MSDQNPDIAVMMMLYNSDEFLEKSLDSLAAQTYQNFHLFIVDDASSDASFETAQRYAQKFPHITLQQNPQNKGVIKNLRDTLSMIEAAMPDAQYFIWACGDDWWSPEYFERTRAALIENPQASVCQTGFDKQDVKAGYKETHRLSSITGNTYKDISTVFYPQVTEGKNGFYNQSIHGLIRMSALRDVYPDSEKTIARVMSTELTSIISLLLNGPILYLDDVMFHKNINAGFAEAYPDDPLTHNNKRPLFRMGSAISHLPRFLQMKRKDVSLGAILRLWIHLFYFYGVLTTAVTLKARFRKST